MKRIEATKLPQYQEKAEGSAKALAEVRKDLPKDLWKTPEKREEVLNEAFEKHKEEKARHKMASYRIEVQFGSKRNTRSFNEANIRVWESAKRLSGQGDVSLHFCASPSCVKPFSARHMTGDVVVCPHCFGSFYRDNCGSQLGPFRQDMLAIRQTVVQLFYTLKGDADIVVKWLKKNPAKAMGETVRSIEQIEIFMEKEYERVVYPYWRILDDTAHGSALIDVLKELMG